MINEPSYLPPEYGWIEVICGGMFSGKTEELIRRAKRAKIAGQKVLVVKPKTDNRYSDTNVVSHNETAIPSVVVSESKQILELTNEFQVICIDEAQFFDGDIVEVANILANHQKRVIVAGLDMDYEGKPFGPMPYLLAIAEFVTKLHAICTKSGMLASYSQRVVEGTQQVMVGEYDAYEPRARHCFTRGIEKREESFTSPHKG
ncbi:MAG: thymidine kinase [Bacteroidetes bacterium]|nr:thymidine kinase [Bacteroidota bacterium]